MVGSNAMVEGTENEPEIWTGPSRRRRGTSVSTRRRRGPSRIFLPDRRLEAEAAKEGYVEFFDYEELHK